jgi:molybdopterin/thiamine biosynthesis adenylyltransferase
MRFALDKPVKIIMLGAGGTGGHIAPHLYRLLYTLARPVIAVIADGDIVEQKNLVRQNFISADLGRNKAQVLAERYAQAFGMEARYIPDFIEDEDRLIELTKPELYSPKELSILISAVDNNKSRRLCHQVFTKVPDLIYIDSGNGEYTGQVVCGIRRKGRTYYKPIGEAYPDVLLDTDKFPTELSCAEAAISAPQSIAANIMAAAAVVSYLYNILVLGSIETRSVTFSTKTVNLKPVISQKKKEARSMSIKTQRKNMQIISSLVSQELGYIDGEREGGPNGAKKQFHIKSAAFLRALGNDLGFTDFKVTKNYGGIAVSGEITLMGMWGEGNGLYLEISQPITQQREFLYRQITHLKDYCGGNNRWLSCDIFTNGEYEKLLETLSALRDTSKEAICAA